MPTDDTPSAAGATNVLLNQRSLEPPYYRQMIGIQGDENPGKAIGFNANGVLTAIPVGSASGNPNLITVGTTTPAEISGASGELTITAKGTNKDITLDPSGTGAVRIPAYIGGPTDLFIRVPWQPPVTPAGGVQLDKTDNLIISNGGTLITRIGIVGSTNPVNPISQDGHSNGISNTFVGINSGLACTTGNLNTFVGDGTGQNCSNGDQNTYIGTRAGNQTTNGYMNTCVGGEAGYFITTGAHNTFLGCDAGRYHTTGIENIAIGSGAGQTTTGSFNVHIGKASGSSAGATSGNTAVGHGTLVLNSAGQECVAIGYFALQNSSANNNTGVGSYALNANTTGTYNTAIGRQAMSTNTSGASNTAIGTAALKSATNVNSSVAVGADALKLTTTGTQNTAIGSEALSNNLTGARNVALGLRAGAYETGSDAFYVDNRDRVNTAGDKAGALLYGTFSATPASQTLKINAAVTTLGSITTGAPAGGTAAPWKLGTVATLTPTSPNRTIEVDIGGVIYYLHAKTTNN